MRFVFVVDAFPSVSETFILNQITGLIDLGHEVFIFSGARPDDRDYHDDIRKYDLLKKTYYHNDRINNVFSRIFWALILLVRYGSCDIKAILNSLNIFKYGIEALSLNYFYKVILFLSMGKIDIILCHYGPNGNFVALIKELGIKGKLVTMFHGYDIRRGIEQGKDIYAPLFERGDAYLSICDYNYKHLVAFGTPVKKIFNHPVGVNTERFVYQPRLLPKGNIKILTISRLVNDKGLFYGLDAVRILIKERGITNIEYHILGDGPQREEFEMIAAKFEIKDNVFFIGSHTQETVNIILHESHLFLLPSIAEALPVVLMEAQATGMPVVATDVGSVNQVMLDAQSGYIVPSKNSKALAEKLQYLIENPKLWAEMGLKGAAHIKSHYDITQLNTRLVSLCEKILNQGN